LREKEKERRRRRERGRERRRDEWNEEKGFVTRRKKMTSAF
jgi:hypothetical protein